MVLGCLACRYGWLELDVAGIGLQSACGVVGEVMGSGTSKSSVQCMQQSLMHVWLRAVSFVTVVIRVWGLRECWGCDGQKAQICTAHSSFEKNPSRFQISKGTWIYGIIVVIEYEKNWDEYTIYILHNQPPKFGQSERVVTVAPLNIEERPAQPPNKFGRHLLIICVRDNVSVIVLYTLVHQLEPPISIQCWLPCWYSSLNSSS